MEWNAHESARERTAPSASLGSEFESSAEYRGVLSQVEAANAATTVERGPGVGALSVASAPVRTRESWRAQQQPRIFGSDRSI